MFFPEYLADFLNYGFLKDITEFSFKAVGKIINSLIKFSDL